MTLSGSSHVLRPSCGGGFLFLFLCLILHNIETTTHTTLVFFFFFLGMDPLMSNFLILGFVIFCFMCDFVFFPLFFFFFFLGNGPANAQLAEPWV